MCDATPPTIPAPFRQALESGDWDRVEELWLEALDAAPIPYSELLEVRRLLWKDGKKNLATTLLELLVEAVEAAGDPAACVASLRELIRLRKGSGKDELERLQAAFAAARAGSPSLDRIVAAYPLTTPRRAIDQLEVMERWLDHDVGTVVEVLGQGVGRVTDLNLELENVRVDLGNRKPVSVPFGAVARYIRRLPPGDFLRRKVEEPAALTDFVEEQPGEALVSILQSLGDGSDVAAIKNALDELLPPARWNTWWAKARKHPRVVSSGSGSRLSYSVSHSAESATETLLDELRSAPPRERPALARRLAARSDDAAAATARFLSAGLAKLELDEPGLAWETTGVLLNISTAPAEAEEMRARLAAGARPLKLLAGVGDRGSRLEALQALRDAHPDDWTTIWSEWLVHEETPSLLDLISSELAAADLEALDASLDTVFRNHTSHPAQFVWAAEKMTEDDCPEPLRRRMTASLLEKLPDTLSRKEFASLRSRAKSLLDGGRVAVRLLLDAASPQQASRFAQRVIRIDCVEPQRARLVEQAASQVQPASSGPDDGQPVLVATATAIERKQKELKQLVEVEIPKTLKGINAAAAEGDLRENFEYHMLRDRQELQSARAAKLQQDLGTVRTLQPGAADTSKVNIGTVVHLQTMDGSELQPLTILGQWDADVERRIFANGTELAQGLLGREVGSEVEVEGVRARITAIEAWQG